jgi:tetratricopeptide (TPR) repeat protein
MVRLLMVLAVSLYLAGFAHAQNDRCTALLLGSLGDRQHPITTPVPEAQRLFSKGMALTFGFNHDEAGRAFRKAADLDPNCGMCYWGMALVIGPNINAPMEAKSVAPAYEAVQNALRLSTTVSAREKALIEALAVRYSSEPVEDRSALDLAFAEAMRKVRERFPKDADVAVLFAEAQMNLSPWDYWTGDGRPKNHILEIIETLEAVLTKDPNHPHAIHLYIHAVEASMNPYRAIPHADRLGELVPGAGHLVHMPAHTYIRTGAYHKASLANERAIVADDAYQAECASKGLYPLAYMPHNHHFLWATYSLEGRGADAQKAAERLRERVDEKTMREPGFGTLQHFWATPLYALARFARWDDALKEPAPPADLLYPLGVWHHLRGRAHAAKGDIAEAEKEAAGLEALIENPALENVRIWGSNKVSDLLKIGHHLLAGEIAEKQGRQDDALEHYRAGLKIENALYYDEPHSWYQPMHQPLGRALLKAGRAAEAETHFRADLERHPENGWSLSGLVKSLAAQGKKDEAEKVQARFQKAWAHADIKLED